MTSPASDGTLSATSVWALAGPIVPSVPLVGAQLALCAGWLEEPPLCPPGGDIRHAFLQSARRILAEPESSEEIARHALARLAERGVAGTDLEKCPVGLITTRRAMADALRRAGFLAGEIRRSRLLSDPRLPGRVIGPISQPSGSILSFWAWQPDDLAPRWLFLNRHWRHSAPLVGLETALVAAAGHPYGLVVVEDPIDALLLQARGLLPVAAIAGRGADLSPGCWRRLATLGVERVTLVLNNGPSASSDLALARHNHRRASQAPELFFVLPERLGPWCTPGALTSACGIDAFRAILEQAWRLTEASAEPIDECEEAALEVVLTPPAADAPDLSHPDAWCALHRCGETDCFCFD